MDMKNIDLNAPAFGAGAQTLADTEAPTTEVEAEVVAPVVEETTQEEAPQEPSEEESKVPYSRFKKFHDEAKQYEREALEWKAKAEALEEFQKTPRAQENTVELPNYWVKLYGDSPESVEAWKIQSEQNERLRQEAREEAIKAVQEQTFKEEARIEQNLEEIDSDLEALNEYVGRELTEKEQAAILDIVDDYTPKDKDGNYLGATIPFEKAYEIYELKQTATKAPIAKARDSVAALSGSKSQGTPDMDEKDKNFNPLDWSAWQKRI